MVFDPTFHEISEEADDLPDLSGTDPDLGEDDIDGSLDDAAAGAAEAGLGETEADDLPPQGLD